MAVGTSCSSILLLVSCILLAQRAAGYTSGPIKVCVPAQQSPAQLGLCTAALSGANVGNIQFTCVAGGSLPGVSSLIDLLVLCAACHGDPLSACERERCCSGSIFKLLHSKLDSMMVVQKCAVYLWTPMNLRLWFVQCFRQVADETADIVSATGEQAFTANQRYGIVPILGEGLPGRDNLSSYYSVAVVNAVGDLSSNIHNV